MKRKSLDPGKFTRVPDLPNAQIAESILGTVLEKYLGEERISHEAPNPFSAENKLLKQQEEEIKRLQQQIEEQKYALGQADMKYQQMVTQKESELATLRTQYQDSQIALFSAQNMVHRLQEENVEKEYKREQFERQSEDYARQLLELGERNKQFRLLEADAKSRKEALQYFFQEYSNNCSTLFIHFIVNLGKMLATPIEQDPTYCFAIIRALAEVLLHLIDNVLLVRIMANNIPSLFLYLHHKLSPFREVPSALSYAAYVHSAIPCLHLKASRLEAPSGQHLSYQCIHD